MCTKISDKISDVSNEQYQIKYLRKYLLNPQRTQPLCLGCLQPADLSCLCPVCKFPFCRCLIKSLFCQHMIFFFAPGQNACKMPRKLTAENVRWFSTMFVANTKKIYLWLWSFPKIAISFAHLFHVDRASKNRTHDRPPKFFGNFYISEISCWVDNNIANIANEKRCLPSVVVKLTLERRGEAGGLNSCCPSGSSSSTRLVIGFFFTESPSFI